jgi:hypothetical protein
VDRAHAAPTILNRDPDDLIIEGVDKGDGRVLYTPHTVRRRLGAMTRLRSSSLILGDQPPISIGGLGFDGSPGIRGGDFLDPGLFDK